MSDLKAMGRTLERLFYVTLADYPYNWLDTSFQNQFGAFRKLDCLDKIYEVFLPTEYKILKKNNKSVYEYVTHPPISTYPQIEGEKYTQGKLAEYLTKVFHKLKKKLDKGDKKTVAFFEKLKMLDEYGNLGFSEINQAPLSKILLFKLLLNETKKGTGILFMFLIIWGIENGDITGEGTEYLEKIAEVYSCLAKQALDNTLYLNELFDELNQLLGTKYKYKFNCEKYEP